MRILLVSNQYAPVIGGIEVLLSSELVPALRRRGHEVEVLTGTHRLAQEPFELREGVPVHRTNFLQALAKRDPIALARAHRHVRAIVADLGPDVVHAHDPGTNLWALLRDRTATSPPTILTLQVKMDALATEDTAEPVRKQLRAVDWVTGVADEVVAGAVAFEPSIAGRTSVIPNAIAVPDVPPPLPSGPPVLVCVGRFVEQKGFDVALRALAELLRSHPDARLLLGGDGPERAPLEALAAQLGVAAAVDFLGVVPHREVAELLARATMALLPSRFEGLPLVGLEAAAAGRPIVSTDVQGLGDVVRHEETGLIVPIDDAAALAAAVRRLLDDRALATRLGAAAHAHVAARYSIDACAAAYESLYQQLVSSGAPRHGL